jgi:hypothetical protein
MLFAYIGPEVMMPVTTVIVGAVGVLMMFGRTIIGYGRGIVRRVWPGSGRQKVAKPNPEGLDEP